MSDAKPKKLPLIVLSIVGILFIASGLYFKFKPTKKNEWVAGKDKMIGDCAARVLASNSGFTAEAASQYCVCTAEETYRRYPTSPPSYIPNEEIQQIAKKCLQK